MVLKTELCRFSGLRVYPGHGMKLARTDGQVFLFLNAKCKRLFQARLKPSKLAWTALYRKAHKKDVSTEAARKKRKTAKSALTRSIVGVSLEVIQKRRSEKTEVRAAARDSALREIKERAKSVKAEKATKKASDSSKSKSAPAVKQPSVKSQPKQGAKGKR